MNVVDLDAIAQADLVRRGEVTPVELVEAAIARINAVEPSIGALVDTRFERALDEAQRDLPDGPFRGVPMLLKDAVQHSAGDRYQHGMRFLRDHDYRSPTDSELVRRYRAAGFVILGRTKVPELTSTTTTEPLAHGPTHNPWNLEHTAGGSSGGSAAAVAARMVPVAHGSDMGGSIRIPASCCGLVGLKPSRHRTSLFPHGEYWGPLAHEHVLTRTVRDSAAVLDATAGAAGGDLHSAPPPARPWIEEVGSDPGSLRIGLITERALGGMLDPECEAAVRDVALTLESLGHVVELASADALRAPNARAFNSVVAAGVAAEVTRWERELGEPVRDLEPMNVALVERGRAVTAVEHADAIDALAAWSHAIVTAYEPFDLLLTPTLPVTPPRLGVITSDQRTPDGLHYAWVMTEYMTPFDVSGQPAISLPTHVSANGLPIGVQVVAHSGREDLVVGVAAQLETRFEWSSMRPDAAVLGEA
ncbi:MAG: amidase [Acidimicrobiia bacterium]